MKYKVIANYNHNTKKWYLDITPPMYSTGNTIVQEGSLYFKQEFETKEDVYSFAKEFFFKNGNTEDFITNEVEYE